MRKKVYTGMFLTGIMLGFAFLVLARPGSVEYRMMPALSGTNCQTSGIREDTALAELQSDQPKAEELSTESDRSTVMPVLRWTRVDAAVAYEVEILKKNENEEGDVSYVPIMPTKQVFTTGYCFVLPDDFKDDVFYWRVRGVDLDGNVGIFSDIEPAYVDRNLPVVEKPIPLSFYNQGNGTVLLYPVYDWIPIPGAVTYEIEILNAPPENPNGVTPSVHRIDAMSAEYAELYDPHARVASTPFYWRVRGKDAAGHPVGVYSDAVPFSTNPDDAYEVATYGDSISHGGGSISYSPTDWAFSYQYYLDFPSINLARSGDTSEMTVERFERDVLPFHPKYLIILMGSNSLRAGESASSVIADMKEVKAKCLQNGIKPVFLMIPPINPYNIKKAFDQDTADGWRERIALTNAWISTQVHINITKGMADENGELYTDLALDGLHLDPPGKQMMANAVNADWPYILSLTDDDWKSNLLRKENEEP